MKKRVLSVFLAGILPILLAGCGSDGSEEKRPGRIRRQRSRCLLRPA